VPSTLSHTSEHADLATVACLSQRFWRICLSPMQKSCQLLHSPSLTPPSLTQPPTSARSLSTLVVQPHPAVSRVRTQALLLLSRPSGGRGNLDTKE
jgi:hypothetical protein